MFTMKADTSKFFDRAVLANEVERIAFEGLRRNAMYIRTVARNSIRRKSKPSAPGQPPRSVRGDLKRGIEAQYQRGSGEALVGPVGFDWGTGAPNTLEFGGKAVIDRRRKRRVGDGGEVRIVSGKAVYAPIRTQAQADRATALNAVLYPPTTIDINGRPFMAPALVKATPKLAPMWAMSVRGGA
jgi:hypothetical protein